MLNIVLCLSSIKTFNRYWIKLSIKKNGNENKIQTNNGAWIFQNFIIFSVSRGNTVHYFAWHWRNFKSPLRVPTGNTLEIILQWKWKWKDPFRSFHVWSSSSISYNLWFQILASIDLLDHQWASLTKNDKSVGFSFEVYIDISI